MKAQVLLPKVFNFPFTYNSKTESKIGNLVEVPFGLKKEKLVRMKTIITSDKCSVDKKDDCEEWNKGNEFSADLCRLIEPIKIK